MKEAIIGYIPALHRGYVEFLRRHKEMPLYLLGKQTLDEFGELHLERDLRALEVQDVMSALRNMEVCRGRTVSGADSAELKLLGSTLQRAVMPDEDISHLVAEKYLASCEVVFDATFLRWDRNRAVLEKEVPADRTVSRTGFIAEVMTQAEKEAEKSPDWWRQVAAVAVKDGAIIASAYNRHLPSAQSSYVFGDPRSSFNAGEHIDLSLVLHSEAAIVAEAARRGDVSLKGADIYVTTFPCPPCAKLLAASGVKRLFFVAGYSKLDALEILRRAGVEIIRVE